MKILTASQMREVDRLTTELGIPGLVLMENAGHRVAEFLAAEFAPVSGHRVVILCGKGNNGGDGLVIARQLHTRLHPADLHVALACPPEDLKGDALANYRMLRACGCTVVPEITPAMRMATVIVDAVLGTGLRGPAIGRALAWIREINTGFPLAKIVAVDVPSGLASDSAESPGETVRADYTVTFTAPKIGQVIGPNSARVGRLIVSPIGSPPELYEQDAAVLLSLIERRWIAPLLAPRVPWSHKGDFGHVLVIAGSKGKTGAAAMSGLSALRGGAGLVTVASPESALATIAAHAAELMTEPLPETAAGAVALRSFDDGRLSKLVAGKDVIAIGPGLGTNPETVNVVRRAVEEFQQPMVIDADGLNALAGTDFQARGRLRVLTPHPGEMARLAGTSTAAIQDDRVAAARNFACSRGVVLVLKGYRTLIAFPDGRVWVNDTGTPAMATGGSGDILTGLIAAFLAQFPETPDLAVSAAVHLHGLSGELGAARLGEKPLIATDLLKFLPAAIDACLPHRD
ncbi:MAG TPA: NAD(P)H-hydrate dehydratase [Bryobacteraceae bacterium]|nr:NAD(P)H-hydrate dehydratase [Bryobacteraceae bacterium]